MKSLLLLALLCWLAPLQADEALWTKVASGGQVLFLRHAQTTPGVGDPPGFKLEDCATQRNLSDGGRAGARRLGEEFRRRKLVLTPAGGDSFKLAGKLSAPAAPQPSPHAIDIPSWFTETLLDLREDVKEAAAQGKRVMLYFGQDGCPYCKTLMQTNFSQRALVDKTRRGFVAIALNIWGDREVTGLDGKTLREKDFARALRVQYTPTLVFFDEKGTVALRLNGYYPPHRLDAALDYASGASGKDQSFADYMKTAVRESARPALHEDSLFRKAPVNLAGKKPVALVFETPYCAGCDELHRESLKRPEVRKLLERFDVYRLTLDDPRAGQLGIAYTPSIVLFAGGREAFRIEAYVRPFHLAGALDYVSSGAWRREPSFQRYLQARAERMTARGVTIDLWK